MILDELANGLPHGKKQRLALLRQAYLLGVLHTWDKLQQEIALLKTFERTAAGDALIETLTRICKELSWQSE